MSVLLIIKLKKIIYSGENIGDDLSFQFNVNNQVTHVKTKIPFGQRKSFNKVIFRGNVTGSSVRLPVSVGITEEDTVFDDTGSGSSYFNVQLKESKPQTYSFDVDVIASGGDKGKRATFTFVMQAVVEHALKVELKDGTTPVDENDYVYITGTPQMPQLSATLKPDGLSGNAKWRLHVKYKRNRTDDDYYPGPDAGAWKTLPALSAWNIASEFGADFRGGKASLYCEYAGAACEMTFHIRGSNPLESVAEAEIGTSPWYAKPIAKWESNKPNQGRYYAQFNTVGTLGQNPGDYKWCPNFGAPNGWGIMQLDNPNPTAQQLWNWKDNIAEGKARLANPYRTDAEAWIASQESQQQAEEPGKPLKNHVFTFNGVDFQKGTARTPVDACTIHRYNGAELWVIFWKNKTAAEPGSWEIRDTHRAYVDNVCGEVD